MVDEDDRRARAALTRLTEPADAALGAWVQRRGAPTVVAAICNGHGADLPAGSEHRRHLDTLTTAMQSRVSALNVERDLAALDRVGGRLVCPGDAEWPTALDDLGPRAPFALWVRGPAHLASVLDRAIAMVGTRTATEYGERVATDLAVALVDDGWTIVSGGAFGIDAASHHGAMVLGGLTVAVLACGVDVTYPRAHHGLFERILERGLLVSELPPGCAPHRHRFLTRNRLIAALAAGTVVVEAAVRSGAKRTATETRALGRPLMVVPGPVTSALSVGCHQMLRADPTTVLVTSAAEVVEMVGRIGADLAPLPRADPTARDHLSPETAQVLDAVPVRMAQGPAHIAGTAGLALITVESALGLLLIEGLVERHAGGWRLSPAGRAGSTTATDLSVGPNG